MVRAAWEYCNMCSDVFMRLIIMCRARHECNTEIAFVIRLLLTQDNPINAQNNLSIPFIKHLSTACGTHMYTDWILHAYIVCLHLFVATDKISGAVF